MIIVTRTMAMIVHAAGLAKLIVKGSPVHFGTK